MVLERELITVSDGKTYEVIRKIGNGSYGNVYLARDSSRPEDTVAIKIEGEVIADKDRNRVVQGAPQEWNVYRQMGNEEGFAHFRGSKLTKGMAIMVIDALGPSLCDLLGVVGGRMHPRICASIAYQGITRLQQLHARGFIHGDIKPDNFLAGPPGKHHILYMIDFGLCTCYLEPSGEHIEYYQKHGKFHGTRRYASSHAHLGRVLSRRDDLESWGYVLLYLCFGKLPWQGFQGSTAAEEVGRKKKILDVARICSLLPEGFKDYLIYVRGLRFEERPDYDKCRAFFSPLLVPGLLLDASLCTQTRRIEAENEVQIGSNKRKRESDGLILETDSPFWKRQRMDLPMYPPYCEEQVPLQWILVFAQRQPNRLQIFASYTTYEELKDFVRRKWEEGFEIADVCLDGSQWAVVMNSGRTTTESMKVSTHFLPFDWISKKYTEGYYISCLAAREGNALIIMSKATNYSNQSTKVGNQFPMKWVARKWREGFFITSIATSGRQWAVVMSKTAFYTDQCCEMDWRYPSEGIRQRWKQGFRVTAIGSTTEQMAFVLTKYPNSGHEAQHTHRTIRPPAKAIADSWQKGFEVRGLAVGSV